MSKFKRDANGEYIYNEEGWNPYPHFKPKSEGMYRILHHTQNDDVVYEDVIYYKPSYDGFMLMDHPDENILAFKRCKYDNMKLSAFARVFERSL